MNGRSFRAIDIIKSKRQVKRKEEERRQNTVDSIKQEARGRSLRDQ
jgi:hypothetical protein